MNDHCATCGMFTGGPAVYHPFLYCELYLLGHRDPGAYLASYGFTRDEEPDDHDGLTPERSRRVRERGEALARSRSAAVTASRSYPVGGGR